MRTRLRILVLFGGLPMTLLAGCASRPPRVPGLMSGNDMGPQCGHAHHRCVLSYDEVLGETDDSNHSVITVHISHKADHIQIIDYSDLNRYPDEFTVDIEPGGSKYSAQKTAKVPQNPSDCTDETKQPFDKMHDRSNKHFYDTGIVHSNTPLYCTWHMTVTRCEKGKCSSGDPHIDSDK